MVSSDRLTKRGLKVMAIRIALVQCNATVGDLGGNAALVRSYADQAQTYGAQVVVFPELCLCGYPPEDLLLRPQFLQDTQYALDQLAMSRQGPVLLVGFAEQQDGPTHNSLAVIRDGKIEAVYRKGLLPNYGVFDEKRYFSAGFEPVIVDINGVKLALSICEDIWTIDWLERFLDGREFDTIINASASPFYAGKIRQRQDIVGRCAKHFKRPVLYCNMVGGQDELVFDGRSMAADAQGNILACAKAFEEDIFYADIEVKGGERIISVPQETSSVVSQPSVDPVSEVWQALVLGTRDYVRKNGFSKVMIGLSGGIDSALTAVIAVEALGKENVVGVTMPSRFNSPDTQSDAQKLAGNLGIQFHSLPIEGVLKNFSEVLSVVPGWDEKGLAYENLQARIRGSLMMSLSNQLGHLVLTTGNKSETAVGYCTLYGDMAGGFAVIKDVPKTLVYQLSNYVNKTSGREVIPQSTVDRIPSAELRDNQKDSDSLPEYDVLDAVLQRYIEQEKSPLEMIDEGFPARTIGRVIRLVDLAEYKRRQSPPGIKITPRAFGRDRRMPITNRYRPGPSGQNGA
ncbi:MAG: NAD+ synthase [Planctomycetes bacterium]|nr:NAD+ synthase [Planctomycetota bacterium]